MKTNDHSHALSAPPQHTADHIPLEFGTLGVPSVCGLGRPLIRVNNHLVARNRPLALALFTTVEPCIILAHNPKINVDYDIL